MKKTNRRTFLKSAAALAAFAPFSGFPAVVKRRNLCSMLSHACIGTGNMAWEDLNGLKAHKDLHVAALCDVDSNYLAAAKKACPDARIYRNALEMLAAEGDRIDSVNVSTPDHTHARYVLDALKRGLNVYAQKPLCHDLADCRRIEKLAAEKGAVTQMGTQIAAWECDRQTADFLKRGAIGEVKHVWLFSNRRGKPGPKAFELPKELPVPETLDWKEWLGDAPFRPYAAGYHPGAWRKWRAFGTSWLGDLGLHVLSPVWIGMEMGTAGPTSVVAEVADDGWTPAQKEQFWPTVSHITWKFPGVKASGGKPFEVEWCDGFESAAHEMEPRFMPPAFLQDVAAKSPYGKLPPQGRVVEGTEGWLLSTHFGPAPTVVLKSGKAAPGVPMSGPAPSHWADYVDCCLQGGAPRSNFGWAARMTEVTLLGNAAQATPGVELKWNAEKGVLA
ncbi:MAG: Gfo/Idh/MocA family oxidoreductase [Kiritimatiellae bacterium]|nr:Gfo/Idh/MocA family oxidoreductase [Kiritimatiellia bacterium]